MKKLDLVGQQFGRLIVVKYAGIAPSGHTQWMCKCSCGASKVYEGYILRRGTAQSCGCFRNEQAAARATKHGMSKTLTYSSWMAMMHRCYTPSRKGYARYGGRGITVCKRWHKFESFYADMGERPSIMFSLERKDNDKNYCKLNCVWATQKTQGNNTSRCRKITYKGVTKTITQWAEHLGVHRQTLQTRIDSGWELRDALRGKL